MEKSGFHTPKRSQMNLTKNNLNTHLSSSKNIIKRRKSFIPIGVLNLLKESNNNSKNKVCSSLKKQVRRSLAIESIPEEQEHKKINKKEKVIKNNSQKMSKFKEYQNNYFINLIKNVYTNESHLNKDNILRKSQQLTDSLKKQIISNKDLFDKRLSANGINFNLIPFSSNKLKNQELNEKDKLTMNSNLNIHSSNYKLLKNITHYFDKNNLSKKEKKSIINYIEKSQEISPVPKHKLNDIHLKSQKSKKKKKKKRNEELLIQNKTTEKEINKDNKNNNNNKGNNNNIVTNNIIQQPEKINCFKAFLCCLKSN